MARFTRVPGPGAFTVVPATPFPVMPIPRVRGFGGIRTTKKVADERRIASQAIRSTASPVQGIINRVLGATPENPITLPIRLPPVTVEASPATQDAMMTNVAMIGLAILGAALIFRR